MKKLIPSLCSLMLITTVGCTTCATTPQELIRISAMRSSSALYRVNGLRLQALEETAICVGAQAGLAWRAEQINCTLKKQEENLDRIYNFRALLLQDDVIPPVLEEARNELALSDCNNIRAADRIYRIVLPPCFVTAPPTWRDYLMNHFNHPEQPDITLLPKNSEEAAVWNCYINIGWQQGVDQANQIFAANLNRLKRDYKGMLLYRVLLAQNMVTPPFVAQTDLGVTGSANELRINDRVLRIAATSELNTNPDTWRPVVAHPNQCFDCKQLPPQKPPIIKKKRKGKPCRPVPSYK